MDEGYPKASFNEKHSTAAESSMTASLDYANHVSDQTPNNKEKKKRASRIIGGGLRQFSVIGQLLLFQSNWFLPIIYFFLFEKESAFTLLLAV